MPRTTRLRQGLLRPARDRGAGNRAPFRSSHGDTPGYRLHWIAIPVADSSDDRAPRQAACHVVHRGGFQFRIDQRRPAPPAALVAAVVSGVVMAAVHPALVVASLFYPGNA